MWKSYCRNRSSVRVQQKSNTNLKFNSSCRNLLNLSSSRISRLTWKIWFVFQVFGRMAGNPAADANLHSIGLWRAGDWRCTGISEFWMYHVFQREKAQEISYRKPVVQQEPSLWRQYSIVQLPTWSDLHLMFPGTRVHQLITSGFIVAAWRACSEHAQAGILSGYPSFRE